jgi:hypothetical protein
MEWRRSWAKNWDAVKYCSDGCRAQGARLQRAGSAEAATAQALEAAILRLLTERGAGKTICPSEAARAVAGEDRAAWEPLMEPARQAARRLVAAGEIVITQGGVVVDPSRARGAIRLKRR